MKYVVIFMKAVVYAIFWMFCIGLILVQAGYKGGLKRWYLDYCEMLGHGGFLS